MLTPGVGIFSGLSWLSSVQMSLLSLPCRQVFDYFAEDSKVTSQLCLYSLIIDSLLFKMQ